MELDSLQGIAGAVVAVVGGAVLHAVVPVANVLKVVHLQWQSAAWNTCMLDFCTGPLC